MAGFVNSYNKVTTTGLVTTGAKKFLNWWIEFILHVYPFSRHAVDVMMQRGAQSDQQQEEHAIFREAANRFDLQLMKGATGDATAKAIHQSKNANLGQFLSGAAKRKLVADRKADEAVQQQYYAYKFQ